jgi:hypothetical protein
MKLFSPKWCAAALAAIALGVTAQPAKAAFTINFEKEFSGSFTDGNMGSIVFTNNLSGGVDVVLTAGADVGKMTNVYFNLSNINGPPQITASAFTFTGNVNYGGNVGINLNYLGDGGNAGTFKADGDGFFDVMLALDNSGDTFAAGDKLFFTIAGVTEANVNDLSAGGDNPNKTGFLGAAHVQGLGPNGNDSGWYTDRDNDGGGGGTQLVPAPAGLVLLASAVPVLALRRLIRRKPAAA